MSLTTTPSALEPGLFQRTLGEKIRELADQPEFAWQDGLKTYAIDSEDLPAARVAVANCPMDYDIWAGLRNPASVGNYPMGFADMWEYYAGRRKQKTDESGRATIFQVAAPFESALEKYRRAVLIAAMLPLNSAVLDAYNTPIKERGMAPWEGYCKAWGEINRLLDRGLTRAAYTIMNADRAVLVMNDATVGKMTNEAIPATHQGASHGVCKGGNYSQKSVAVLSGLAQFGVSRMVFRDETEEGVGRRLIGVLRSVVVFDPEDCVTDGSQGIRMIDDEWKAWVAKLSDFTVADSEVNRRRYCTYIPEKGENGCGKCVSFCPSNALKNSSPLPSGAYSDRVASQSHRFYGKALQFDNGSCCDERGQLSELYDEWMCGRCVSICGGEGVIRA